MRRLAAALGLLGTILCASCGGAPKTYYYTLRVLPAPPASDPKTSFVLGVERFRGVEMLRDDRIIYYRSPTELNFYQYHRWSADPGTMLAEMAARWLDEMGIFTFVRMLPSREPVDYILRGRLFNFEEVDYEGGGTGRVNLVLTLVRARDHQVVWTFTRQVESPIQETGVTGVVNALNASSEQLLREALAGLAARIESEFRESQQHPQ